MAPSKLIVTASQLKLPDGRTFRCAVGSKGIGNNKQEGDGLTPAGAWPVRCVLYRADRIEAPNTSLPIKAIEEPDVWIDQPYHQDYNKLVTLPIGEGVSYENLWRDENLYDLLIVLGYNDDPVVANKGSAIFMHITRGNYDQTSGCIALSFFDLLHVVAFIKPGDSIVIE